MILLMTASGAPADRVTNTEVLTATHLAILAVFAVLVIVGILWGARQKRVRVASEAEEERRTDALLAHPPTATAPSPSEAEETPDARPTADTRAAADLSAKAPVERQRASEPKVAPPAATTEPAPPAAPSEVATPTTDTSFSYGLINIKGLGPKAIPLLKSLGITDLAAMAALDEARAAEIDAQLGTLSGRMKRDRWVEQARLLAAGDVAAFEETYGKLG